MLTFLSTLISYITCILSTRWFLSHWSLFMALLQEVICPWSKLNVMSSDTALIYTGSDQDILIPVTSNKKYLHGIILFWLRHLFQLFCLINSFGFHLLRCYQSNRHTVRSFTVARDGSIPKFQICSHYLDRLDFTQNRRKYAILSVIGQRMCFNIEQCIVLRKLIIKREGDTTYPVGKFWL